jgi:hypothetical protein
VLEAKKKKEAREKEMLLKILTFNVFNEKQAENFMGYYI